MKKRISEKKVKRKVKEIKSSKKVIEVSDKPDESDLEKSVEVVRDFQPEIKIREINSSPVLEKVAEDEGVSWTRTRGIPKERDDDEEVKYKESESDYMVKPGTTNNRLDVNKLESPIDYESISQEKRSDEMRRLMEQAGERIPGRNERGSWEDPEKSMEVGVDDKTKKYVGKGDGY